MKTRLLKTALCASALLTAAVVATPVHADGIESLVTLSSSNVTVTEGDTGRMLFTLSNDSSTPIGLNSLTVNLEAPFTGDTSDFVSFLDLDSHLTTCGPTLAPMSSCNYVFDVHTPSDADDTDHDSGGPTFAGKQSFDTPTGVGYNAQSPAFTITVNDTPVSTTPEPSSLLLLGSGLLGMLGLGRKRLI